LWGDEKIVRFSRPIDQGEFKLDAKNSEESEAYVEKIFSSLEAEPQLYDLIRDHLLAIAHGPHERRREWLKEVLDNNPTLPELAPVRAAFGKKP
jgi:hypothetical protein